MTEHDYHQIERSVEAALDVLRRNDTELQVSEIRVRADLEAVYSDLLKLALRRREQAEAESRRTAPPFQAGAAPA